VTTLTEASRAVAAIRDLPEADRIPRAHALVAALDAVLTDHVEPETTARLWLQLARAATGRPVTTKPGAERAAALEAIGPAPRRGRGQPLKHGEQLVRFPLRLPESLRDDLERAAAAAGRSMNDEIIARCSAGTAATGE
jgi:hypothetical protein